MSADSRLCTLSHFYLDCGSDFEIILVNAETSGCDLNYSVFTIAVKILVKSSLACVIADAKLCCGSCK